MRDRVLPVLGDAKLAQLTTPDLQQFVDRLVADNADPSTIQNSLILLPANLRARHPTRRGGVQPDPRARDSCCPGPP